MTPEQDESQLRVLHVNAGNMYGGIERALTTFAQYRSSDPALVQEFALCFEGRQADELREAGVDVHLLGKARFSRPWTVAAARHRLSRLLKSRRFDVVLTHGGWCQALAGPVARRLGLRLANYVHGPFGSRPWFYRIVSDVSPDGYIANSEYTVNQIRAATRKPVHLVRPPIQSRLPLDDRKTRASIRGELGVSEFEKVILLAGRLEPLKGHLVLIKAAGLLPTELPWRIWIAGGPQSAEQKKYLNELQNEVRRLELASRVLFLGERTDVPRLMSAADVYCQPNTAPESFGLTFVEALQAGLPVVTSDIGGAREILTPGLGFLTTVGDAHGVAKALTKLLVSSSSKEEIEARRARVEWLTSPERQLQRLHRALLANDDHGGTKGFDQESTGETTAEGAPSRAVVA
jgi:glycosyltransferase involved in cell wall biosynthesis